MNLSPLLLAPKTLLLLDPTAADGETSLSQLTAEDTHVSLVVLMYGRSSNALHEFAKSEGIDLSTAASIYLDQVADRIAAPDRVVETLVSGGSDPATEISYLAALAETRRVLVPASLHRSDPGAVRRITKTRPGLVVDAPTPVEDSAQGSRKEKSLRTMMPMTRRIPKALNQLSFAAQVPAPELRRMSKLGTVADVAAQSRVIAQGSGGNQFMVVLDGSFTVERDGAVIADLGPGQIAGEMALLSGLPCNASVVASAGASVFKMGPSEFATLLETCPAIAAQLQQTAQGRLVNAA